MKKFLGFWRLAMSENGLPSSKRVTMFLLLFAYLFILFTNLFTGKKVDDTLQNQLYYMLNACLIAVMGSNVISAVSAIKMKQSDNNANVGQPSPTPANPPIVAGAAPTIITQ